jgi:hypothetical protein
LSETRIGRGVGAFAALAIAAWARAQPAPPPLARLTVVDRTAELREKGRDWQNALEGAELPVGAALRVGPDAVARLELPWMALTLSAGASLRFADQFLLSASLGSGRALVEAESHDALPIVTEEAAVRGRGRAVVRRSGRATLVTCLAGRFHVSSARGALSIGPGEGSVVLPGRAPSLSRHVPDPPSGLWPGRDPVYLEAGAAIELRWRGRAAAYEVELLPVGTEVVLVQRDVVAPPARIAIPWPGAFRWRVAALDAQGIEGLPSEEGLLAVE